MPTLSLPGAGGLEPFTTRAPRSPPVAAPPFPRVAYAAAHVVADPMAAQDPWLDAKIDWDRTIAFRRHLWSLGLGVAEAMDTAQRGMRLDWHETDHARAMDVALEVIAAHAAKVDGIKISLLDDSKEIAMRRRLPAGVRMYTGDDFNFPDLIAGDAQGYSDALLGIFDPIAPAVGGALAALGMGGVDEFHAILAPTVPLSRHIFQAPTRFYKTGVVFMAWLNGHQDHFTMVGGQQSARSLQHFAELFRLADRASLLHDPDLAAARMRTLLALHGVG